MLTLFTKHFKLISFFIISIGICESLNAPLLGAAASSLALQNATPSPTPHTTTSNQPRRSNTQIARDRRAMVRGVNRAGTTVRRSVRNYRLLPPDYKDLPPSLIDKANNIRRAGLGSNKLLASNARVVR